MFTLPIPAKIKAVVGLLCAVAIVLTGVTADNVLDLNDVAKYGAQLIEAIGTYAAIFKAPRNVSPTEVTFTRAWLTDVLKDGVSARWLHNRLVSGEWPDDVAARKGRL